MNKIIHVYNLSGSITKSVLDPIIKSLLHPVFLLCVLTRIKWNNVEISNTSKKCY